MQVATALGLLSILVASVLPRDAHADEVQMTPLTAFRDMTVIVSVTDGEASDSQGGPITSKAQGTYVEEWDLSVSLPTAVAQGQATQISDVGPNGLHAEATLATSASAQFEGAASVIASNVYQVTFTTDGPTQCNLQGSLSAFEEATGTLVLSGVGVEHIFEVTDGSVPINVSEMLPAGSYLLFAEVTGDANVNLPVEETLEATASFAFDFTLCAVTPVEDRSWGEVKAAFEERTSRD